MRKAAQSLSSVLKISFRDNFLKIIQLEMNRIQQLGLSKSKVTFLLLHHRQNVHHVQELDSNHALQHSLLCYSAYVNICPDGYTGKTSPQLTSQSPIRTSLHLPIMLVFPKQFYIFLLLYLSHILSAV